MKRAPYLGTALALTAVLLLPQLAAAQGMEPAKVYLTNLSKQVISPPLVVSHTWKVAAFVPGEPASEELALLAEDGDASALADALAENEEVLDVAVADAPLMPGETVVLDLQLHRRFNRVSAVGMLVTTNDAFFGLSNFYIAPNEVVSRTSAPAWDAGTEANNELCAFIPGPPCGSHLVRDTNGAEGFVHIHPGIHGTGDLLPNEWDWHNPTVMVTVIKN